MYSFWLRKLDSREAVYAFVRDNPGCRFKHIVEGVDFSRPAISRRLQNMLIDGELTTNDAPGHKKYFIGDVEIELDM